MITLIGGSVEDASSIAVPDGSISLVLNTSATVLAGGGLVMAAVPVVFQFDSDGNLVTDPACQIWSNEELSPQNSSGLGTWYSVTLYDSNGGRLNAVPLIWQFTQVSGSTVDISLMVATNQGTIYHPAPVLFVAPPAAPAVPGSLVIPDNLTVGGNVVITGSFTFAGGQIILDGATSGSCTITAPAIAGTITNPIAFSNSLEIPNGTVYQIGTDLGLSRDSAGVLDVGNGAAGDFSGSIKALAITAQGNITLGKVGGTSGTVTLTGTTSGTATITGPAVAGVSTNPILFSNSLEIPNGTVYQIGTDLGLSRDSAGVLDVGNGAAGDSSATIKATIINAVTGFQVGGAATSGHYLRGNGTDYVDGAIQAADVPTLNQNTTGTAANLSGTPALPNGTTATTQASSDNSTNLATTAFVQTAVVAGSGVQVAAITATYTNNTTGFTTITGSSGPGISFTAAANTTYVLTATLPITLSTTTGYSITLTGPTSTNVIGTMVGDQSTTTRVSSEVSALGSSLSITGASTGVVLQAVVRFTFTTGVAGGTVALQAKCGGPGNLTMPAGTSAVLIA